MKRILLLALLGLAACSNPAQEARPGTFYDLKTFLNTQIAALNAQKPAVLKRMSLNGQLQNETMRVADWTRELDLFLQADINKQAYQASYTVSRPDSLTYEYQLKPEENLPVGYLKVILDSLDRQPRRVEAILLTKNSLYESRRMLWLETRGGTISRYHIEGFQQLAWLEKKPFMVEGLIQ